MYNKSGIGQTGIMNYWMLTYSRYILSYWDRLLFNEHELWFINSGDRSLDFAFHSLKDITSFGFVDFGNENGRSKDQ